MKRLAGWMASNARNFLFTLGVASLTAGFAMAWFPLGFMAFGVIVCGLMILDRIVERKDGKRD